MNIQGSSDTSLIDVAELRDRLGSDESLFVLDLRTPEDRNEWAIPGSVHADVYHRLKAEDAHALDDLDLSPDVEVVTVCGVGKVAATAAAQLRARGVRARTLAGGMKAWSLAWNTAEVPLSVGNAKVLQIRRTGKGCLSYLVGSGGEAAVIDPSLDPETYVELAHKNGWVITHVLDTHIHADHLMRSHLLAKRATATQHLPVTNRVAYPFLPLRDGESIDIGNVTLLVMATPGHTPESISFRLDDEVVFTGDTLFVNGVGRPDLEADREQARARSGQLYRSLQALLRLPPSTIVLPGHTNQPAAFNGEPIGGTLAGIQDGVAMLRLSEADFVESILARIPPTPPNHHQIVQFNEAGVFPDGDPTDLEAGANRCAIA